MSIPVGPRPPKEQNWSLKDIIKEAQGELKVHKPTPAPLETEEDEMESSGEAPEDISIVCALV